MRFPGEAGTGLGQQLRIGKQDGLASKAGRMACPKANLSVASEPETPLNSSVGIDRSRATLPRDPSVACP